MQIKWRYLPQVHRNREVRHAFVDWGEVTARTPALCGVLPSFLGDWYGTGTQAEYERAASLRTCEHCRRRLVRLGYEDPGAPSD